MSSTDEVVQAQGERLVGQVKWFNNKAGYGFITVSDGEHSGKDIFVHFTTVRVANSQYKYLVQGEYVEFSISKTDSGAHEFQATEITGIKGGSIMCETRRVSRELDTREMPADARPARRPLPRRPLNKRRNETTASAPSEDEEGFTTVTKKTDKRK
jgi:cold shock CspA family protein